VKTCRKIIIERLTGDFRTCTAIVEQPRVEPAADQVRIRNHYAGVNAVVDRNLCRNAGQVIVDLQAGD